MTRTRNISDLLDSNGDVKSGSLDNVPAVDLTNLSATNLTSGTIPAARFPSTIDGRDLSTDGTKLDAIEASATADQTASEIRTLVESASDSNVFTDADHTKLNAIEASADVTDATNVAAAGALMTSGGSVTGDVSFGDNNKAIFGAGSDLQIYHDGSNSYIVDNGTGDLVINTNGNAISLNPNGGGEYGLRVLNNGAVNLYHDNALKLATTSTGATVTGTLAATAVTGDGSGLTNLPPSGLPSGTKALFVQTAAPTGWTKDTTHNNKALRIVSGSVGTGGSSSFTSALGTPSLSISVSGSTGSTTISSSSMPSHSHGIDSVGDSSGAYYTGHVWGYRANAQPDYSTFNTGGGGSHNHSLSASASGTAGINVQYVDVIIATKD